MASNDKSTITVGAHLRELGARIASLRLSRNLTQTALAQEAGASKRSVIRLEAGENVSLETFIRLLIALGLADQLVNFLPKQEIRPVERVRIKHERQRARGGAAAPSATDWAWGEEEPE